jgi:hypothetical protein
VIGFILVVFTIRDIEQVKDNKIHFSVLFGSIIIFLLFTTTSIGKIIFSGLLPSGKFKMFFLNIFASHNANENPEKEKDND